MGLDYYKVLEVDNTANNDELKKAYHKLAMKWHPDKNPNNKTEAEAMFKTIGEAYNILGDPQTRANYDLFGKDGFSGNNGDSSSTTNGCNWDKSDGCGSSTSFAKDIFGRGRISSESKSSTVEHTLSFSLEDLYRGTTKRMKISRDVVVDTTGKSTLVEEILTIDVKPGWKKGTKVTFPKKGIENPGTNIPSDLVFIIDEKPHTVFKRDGNDLVVTKKISLVEALTGYTAKVTTLDGRMLTIPIDSVISPTYEEVVIGEGMPISKVLNQKGNLRIKFKIEFPTRLNLDQKMDIKRLLMSS